MARRVVKRKPRRSSGSRVRCKRAKARSDTAASLQPEPVTLAELMRLFEGDMPPDDDMLFWSAPGPLPSEERAAEGKGRA